jgi:DNA-nicking Smr family endonuclease
MSRRLRPEETALWGQVAATVKPMRGKRISIVHADVSPLAPAKTFTFPPARAKLPERPLPPQARREALSGPQTLDANWDKSLANGRTAPDRTIDLHGHSLSSAHALLDHSLGEAIRHGARLVLLVTGKPARHNPRMPPTGRGVIRASVEDWLKAGPHASRIAAIRGAHPKHGGAGALYLVIRRERERS